MAEQQITTIDREASRLVNTATRDALEEVAARFGLTVKVGGGTFDPAAGTFKPKVEFAMADSERRKFEADAPYLYVSDAAATGKRETSETAFLGGSHILPSDYGIVVQGTGTQRLRLVGINLRAPKFPFLFEVVGTDKKMKGGETFAFKIISARAAK